MTSSLNLTKIYLLFTIIDRFRLREGGYFEATDGTGPVKGKDGSWVVCG
jgi:hypothetical protein